ncbi:MAG: hypothetical protein M3R17_17285 [Bacteroidota bacterium]|nr:hypothetical protein [Bacteroidota bacterium]
MKHILSFLFIMFIQQTLFARLPDLIPFYCGYSWGYCDSTKKMIISCKFTSVTLFGEADSARGSFKEQEGWIMKNGDFHQNVVSEAVYYNFHGWTPSLLICG